MAVILVLLLSLSAGTIGLAVEFTQATAVRNRIQRDTEQTRSLPGEEEHTRLAVDRRDAGGAWWGPQQHRRSLAARRKRRIYHPNRPSSYLSLGKVRPFSGDVHPSDALHTALGSRSYKRELILMTDTRPRAAVQLHDNLAQLGLVHLLWLTNSQSICAAADGLLAARANLHGQKQQQQQQQQQFEADGFGAGSAASSRRALRNVPYNVSAAMVALAAANEVAASWRRNTISDAAGGVAGPAATSAGLGCVWYDQPFPDSFGGHRRLMMKRVMLIARTVRQGYNVLSMDTDVILFREPYIFFKTPPYAAAHMLVGKAIRGGSMVNTGVMYFQNVSRDGPVSWLLTEAIERNLRWVEPRTAGGGTEGLLAPHEAERRGCWDQLLFGDVVLTIITRKLSLYYCARLPDRTAAGDSAATFAAKMAGTRKTEEDGGWNTRHRTALGLADKQSPSELFARHITSVTDPDLQALVAGDSYITSLANITIPRDPPPLLPDEPGYALPPRVAGGLAEQFQRLLAADDAKAPQATGAGAAAGAARRLQQTDSSSNGASAGGGDGDEGVASSSSSSTAGPVLAPLYRDVETFAYAAEWLVGGWTQRGVMGYWDPALTNGVPRQVFAHLVRAPGPTAIGKEAVRMQYGEYDWELAALTDGGPFPFLGSANASDLPRVVALLPDLDTTTSTPVQWSNMARGLAQVALLTGRRVVWPAVPCASKWVQPNPGSRRALPLNPNLRFLAHGSFADGLMCLPAVALHQKCLFERWVGGRNDSAEATGVKDEAVVEPVTRREGPRGLLPMEFDMLLNVLPASVVTPGPHNTVHLQTNDDYDDGGERPVMFDEPPRAEGITYVKAAAVAQALREPPLADQPVLYFAQRTFLTQLDKLGDPDLMTRYRTFRNECPALR